MKKTIIWEKRVWFRITTSYNVSAWVWQKSCAWSLILLLVVEIIASRIIGLIKSIIRFFRLGIACSFITTIVPCFWFRIRVTCRFILAHIETFRGWLWQNSRNMLDKTKTKNVFLCRGNKCAWNYDSVSWWRWSQWWCFSFFRWLIGSSCILCRSNAGFCSYFSFRSTCKSHSMVRKNDKHFFHKWLSCNGRKNAIEDNIWQDAWCKNFSWTIISHRGNAPCSLVCITRLWHVFDIVIFELFDNLRSGGQNKSPQFD